MASLPGMPGSLGIQGIQPLATGGGSTGGGSDLSLDIPQQQFTGESGTNGFNQWSAPPNGFPIGIDPVSKLVYASNLVNLYTFDFSAGAPASPSEVAWNIDPAPTGTATDRPFLLTSDNAGEVWLANVHDGGPSDIDVEVQSYSISGGSQVSTVAGAGSGASQIPESVSDTFRDGGTCFSVSGQQHLAMWYAVYNPSISTYDSVFLEIYDISAGTASSVASISFDLDSTNFSLVVDGCIFYDGASSLWTMVYTIDDHGQPTAGTLHKFAVPSYAEIGSASFSGAYGFVGDSCSGHVYVLNIDGSVSDVDPATLVATTYFGLASSISNPVGIAWLNGYPIVFNRTTFAMLNPVYGMSTDPVTSQFFISSGEGIDTYSRVQNFIAVDSLTTFTDWGISGPVSHSRPVWIPSEQAMFYFAIDGTGERGWYELKYAPRDPFCAGETPPTTSDVDEFLPNAWVTA